MNVSRLGRQARRSLRFSKWPLRRRVAVVAWIPVLVLWFLLYTGPNSAANSEPGPATTTTTEYVPSGPLPTTPPKTVPENGLLVGALPDVTPRLPPIVSDQYRVLIDQASRIQTAEKRPSAAVTRELNRIQNALRKAQPPDKKALKIKTRAAAKKNKIPGGAVIRRPERYPNVDDVINFVQFKMRSRRGRMVSAGLVLFAAGAVAVTPSLLHSRETPARQAQVPQTSPIDIGDVPTQVASTSSSSVPISSDLVPVGDPGPRIGADLPTATTAAPPQTAPPATAPPQTAPPQTAPPQTAPPATAPPPPPLR